MKTFQIGIGVRCDKVQTCMLNYALLKTGGVALEEFMRYAPLGALDSLFGARLSKRGNQLQFEVSVFESLADEGAKTQLMQLVLVQLAAADISLGEFQSEVVKQMKDAKRDGQ